MQKEAVFYKNHARLDYWDSKNTKLSGTYCKGKKQAQMTLQMIEATRGVKQILIVKNSL